MTATAAHGSCQDVEDPARDGGVLVALRLAQLRERPRREQAKTRLAAIDAARGRLPDLAPLLRQQLGRPLDDHDRRLVEHLAELLADPPPSDLARELEELLAMELTATGELEGLLERLDQRLRPLRELEEDLLWRLEQELFEQLEEELFERPALTPKASKPPAAAQAWAQANMARALAELEEAQAEARLRLRLAEAADEADEAMTAPPAGDTRAWNEPRAAWEDGEMAQREWDEALADTVMEEVEERIWWYLEDRGAYSREWVEWAEAEDEAHSAEDRLEDAQTEVAQTAERQRQEALAAKREARAAKAAERERQEVLAAERQRLAEAAEAAPAAHGPPPGDPEPACPGSPAEDRPGRAGDGRQRPPGPEGGGQGTVSRWFHRWAWKITVARL